MGKTRQNDEEVGEAAGSGRDSMNMLHMTADLIPEFSGRDATYSVDKWIQEVEDNAEIFSWTPLQKLLVARRALVGTAALWLRAERPHKTWEALKAALNKEFADSLDSKSVHEIMSARKKGRDESCLDYVLVMKELGKRGKMPDYVAIKYIVDGIVDKESNKIMLYGVSTYGDLKEKLKIYEIIEGKMKNENDYSDSKRPSSASNQLEERKCYNCGEGRHISADCPHKSKGAKCFNCNSFGHVSSQCSARGGGGSNHNTRNMHSTSGNNQRGQVGSTARTRSHSAEAGAGGSRQTSATTYCCECESERSPTARTVGNTEMQDGGGGGGGLSLSTTSDGSAGTVIPTADVWNVNSQQSVKKPIKTVNICGKDVSSLIDSGSEVNLISFECYRGLGSPKCDRSDIILTGLGATKVRASGLLSATVRIDDRFYDDTSFHIVSKDVMPFGMIIGQQLLRKTILIMSGNDVFLRPSNEEWLRKITSVVSDLDIVDHESRLDTQQQARELVVSYQPLKAKQKIAKVQEDNRSFIKKPKENQKRVVEEVGSARRTKCTVFWKVKPKYLGPYKVTAVKSNDRYEVNKPDDLREGPKKTSSAADSMKRWPAGSDSGSE